MVAMNVDSTHNNQPSFNSSDSISMGHLIENKKFKATKITHVHMIVAGIKKIIGNVMKTPQCNQNRARISQTTVLMNRGLGLSWYQLG